MSRFLYRCLIWLHPRAFYDRFGDEMLCAFDEALHAGIAPSFADGFVSLARQWLFRSGLWRLAIGAAATALLIVAYAHSEAKLERKQLAAQRLFEARQVRPVDKVEFNHEAAQAVAMLAHYREALQTQQKKSHPQPSAAPVSTNQD